MLRQIIAKVLKSLLSKVETKKEVVSVEQYCTITTDNTISKGTKVHDTHETKNTNIMLMDSRELQEYINESVEQIHAELLVKGYKELKEILEQHEAPCVQNFVISQLCSLGQYDPEKDNLDQYNKEALVNMAVRLNQRQYIQRMKDAGRLENIKPSAAQLSAIESMCKKLKVQVIVPEDKLEASEVIESLKKRLPKTDNKPSEAQINAINKICKKVGRELAITEMPTDKQSASKMIADLQKEIGEDTTSLATKAQVDYVKRLLQMQKKRWTAKREEEYSVMSSKDISKVIEGLQKECKELGLIDNKASEGQVNYIISLGKRLRKAYNPIEVKELDKEQASKIIETLQREYLYTLYLGNGHKMAKEEIAIMPLITVRQLIDQLEREKKTAYYERSAEDYTTGQACL